MEGRRHGDLADLDEIRDVARQAGAFGRFDAVIHNAGTMNTRDAGTVNTVAPYVLTALMAKPARLVHLSSSMHRSGSTDLRGLAAGSASYSDSKLWVTTLALAFASRWEEPPVTRSTPGGCPRGWAAPAHRTIWPKGTGHRCGSPRTTT